ncbi:hypothetical protein BN1047_01118 [Mycolicibacterium neoaurum]|uniref:Uncharacterized protein n=1 Tax=Mycolicibacterium neoaurum TaxID=1795 RepID=A0AAV2WHR2_MYCNE|nr:hypothetical protein BN1047_01118 [Mycolicibacterium neoaurum]
MDDARGRRVADARLRVVGDRGHHGLDGGLGRPVTVVRAHPAALAFGADALPGRGVDVLPAEGQHGQRHGRQQAGGTQLAEHRRGGVDHVHAEPADLGDQRLGVPLHARADDVDAVPLEERHQRLPRRVEGERPCVRDPQIAAQPILRRAQHPGRVVRSVGEYRVVGSDDTLRFSGGSRGEDDVCALSGAHCRGDRIGGEIADTGQ